MRIQLSMVQKTRRFIHKHLLQSLGGSGEGIMSPSWHRCCGSTAVIGSSVNYDQFLVFWPSYAPLINFVSLDISLIRQRRLGVLHISIKIIGPNRMWRTMMTKYNPFKNIVSDVEKHTVGQMSLKEVWKSMG